MSLATCRNLLGVFGTIGSGKSYFAKLAAHDRGYDYVSADTVFKEYVRPLATYREALCIFFESYGVAAIASDGSYNSKAMTSLLFTRGAWYNPWKMLNKFNKMNLPFLLSALDQVVSDKPTILEMAPMVSVPQVWDACSLRLCIESSESLNSCVRRILARDVQRNEQQTRAIYEYQQHLLTRYHEKCCFTFRMPDYYSIYNQNPDGFIPDEDMLAQFDTIMSLYGKRKDLTAKHT